MSMWAEAEFGSLPDFHGRNRGTLVRSAELIYRNIGKSFSASLGKSLRQSTAKILSKKDMDTHKMLEGHYQSTINKCKTSPTDLVIVAQDTTYYNMSGHKGMAGLGPLQGNMIGSLQHNALALDRSGVPLGLLGQHNWTRGGLGALGTESDKWYLGLEWINKAAPLIGKPMLLTQDREADMLSFLAAERAVGVELLVRIHYQHILRLEQGDQMVGCRLREAISKLAAAGQKQVQIRRDNQDITLTLQVRAGSVKLLVDRNRKRSGESPFWLVVATETAAVDKDGSSVFDPDHGAEWILLTTLDPDGSYSALDVVDFYSFRWRVERLHYVLKSGGLKVDKLQFNDVATFFNALGFYSIIGCRIVGLTYALRQEADRDPELFFSPLELKVLEGTSRGKKARTLKDAVQMLAGMEGFSASRKQPFPGPKVLGAALVRLHHIMQGVLLAQNLSLQD